MNIRFYNARLLSMSEGTDIVENAELLVKGNRIIFLGTTNEANMFLKNNIDDIKWEREIDCSGNLLMPGFKNAHTHSAMTCLRSFADDLPLDEWLRNKIFPVEAKLTSEDIYILTKLAVLEYVSGGITAIFDMYIDPEAVSNACVDTGMRCVQVGSVNDFTLSVEEMERLYLKWNNENELISYILGFHAQYTTSEELLRGVAGLAKKYKAPVYTHLSETKKEVSDCITATGMTPTAYLDSLGIFDFGGGGYHCIYMNEKDMEIFEKKKLNVVTNPASNLKLASGIAPIETFRKKGINIAIGTDGPASNNCLDMFREMFLVSGLAKYRENDASIMDADEVLKMATINGAKVMNLTESDVLAPGKLADLIMIDMHGPNMQPINNISKNIVYSGGKQNVKLTMINGMVLFENGVYSIGEDPEKIYSDANRIIQRITSGR